MRRYPWLHHLAAGAVSISVNGEEVAITLAKALSLDSSHQACTRETIMRASVALTQVYHRDALWPAALCRHVCLHVVTFVSVCAPLRCSLVTDAVQVVGRVHGGEELLARLNGVQTDGDDMPLQRTVVLACGLTDNQASSPAFEACSGCTLFGRHICVRC